MNPLDELLRPYRDAVAGKEMSETDPVYSMLLDASSPSSSSSPSMSGGAVPTSGLQALVKRMAARREGWTGDQWAALQQLIANESGWNPTADNPTSSAYGLFQFLDSTRDNYGISTGSPLRAQIRAGLDYIDDRYSDPLAALQFWQSNDPHWY